MSLTLPPPPKSSASQQIIFCGSRAIQNLQDRMQRTAYCSNDILHTYDMRFSGIIAGCLPPVKAGTFRTRGTS